MNARFLLMCLAAIAASAAPFGASRAYAQLPAEVAAAPLSLADAKKMIEAAQKTATDMNLRVSIAVVDARGDLIALGRMPGAGAATPDTAIGKAMLSVVYGQPSAALVQRATSPITQAFNDATGGRLRFLQGAVPIVRNGVIVGAVAASGATSQQDEDIAKSGLRTIS